MAHLSLGVRLHGVRIWWFVVYPLVHTGGLQVLVRSLPAGRSAGPQVRRSAFYPCPHSY